jgi:hypothetical protein
MSRPPDGVLDVTMQSIDTPPPTLSAKSVVTASDVIVTVPAPEPRFTAPSILKLPQHPLDLARPVTSNEKVMQLLSTTDNCGSRYDTPLVVVVRELVTSLEWLLVAPEATAKLVCVVPVSVAWA